MNKSVLMGLIFGLGIGIVESLMFSEEQGLAKIASDLTMATVILGMICGMLRGKFTETKNYLPICALVGAAAGFLLSLRSGLMLDDTVLMAINGLFIGALIHFGVKKRKIATAE